MPTIHPLSVVDPKATLAEDVEVGPFCVIGPDVTIGAGTKLMAHVVIHGHTTVGKNNLIFPNAVLGSQPQDKKWKGEPTGVVIGDNNHLRESVTIHAGTVQDKRSGGITRLGNNNLLMVNAHLGHDAQFGNNCIIANNVMIAGHVVCGNNVVMLGGVGVHHFVTIGDFAYIAGASRIHHDVPPFVKVSDDDIIRALNAVGLRRAGFDEALIEELDEQVRHLFVLKAKPFSVMAKEFMNGKGTNPYIKQIVEFVLRRNQGKHGRYLEALRNA
jgi:UDP-N-acetylglucosamine acyltransferase